MKNQALILCAFAMFSSVSLAAISIQRAYSNTKPTNGADDYCIMFSNQGYYLSWKDFTLSGSDTCTETELWRIDKHQADTSTRALKSPMFGWLQFNTNGAGFSPHPMGASKIEFDFGSRSIFALRDVDSAHVLAIDGTGTIETKSNLNAYNAAVVFLKVNT